MKRTNIDEMICKQEGIAEVTREALNKIQLAKLNAVLKREKEREGFYRNLPEKLENLDALKTFPFTTESELAKNSGRMLLCSQGEVQRVISEQTSGTTGAGKRVFYTEGDCEHTIELFMAGLGEFIYPGSITMVAMPFSGPFGLGELIAEAIRRLGAKQHPASISCQICFCRKRKASQIYQAFQSFRQISVKTLSFFLSLQYNI